MTDYYRHDDGQIYCGKHASPIGPNFVRIPDPRPAERHCAWCDLEARERLRDVALAYAPRARYHAGMDNPTGTRVPPSASQGAVVRVPPPAAGPACNTG